ncbi:MAG: hypothetical protein ACRDRA_02400 [Pseudonocardiaceae bacterium]
MWARRPECHPDLRTTTLKEIFKEIVDLDGLAAERPDLRIAVDDFGLADDGTVAAFGDRGLWSPHVAGITVEALAAMQDVVVRGVVQAVHSPA